VQVRARPPTAHLTVIFYPTPGTPAGFSQIDLEAAQQNTVTNSVITTSNGTTGLDIEANDVAYFATVQIGTVSGNVCAKLHKRLTPTCVASTGLQDHHGQRQFGLLGASNTVHHPREHPSMQR
jgi:hypothetical protein